MGWADAAARQHGVVPRGAVTRDQAATLVRRQVLARQNRALVVVGSPESYDRTLWITQCALGGPMAFSGTTALALYGVPVTPRPRPVALVPRHRRPASGRRGWADRVVAREFARSRVIDGHPVTSVAVSLRRAGAELRVDDLAVAVEHALRLRLVTVEQLRRCLGHGLVGARALRAALDVVSPDSHSVWERRLASLLRAAALPRPRRQVPVAAGRIYWLDFLFLPWHLAVEVDGFAAHAQPDAFVAGLRRTRAIAAHGIEVLAFAPREIAADPAQVVLEVAAHLRRRGAPVPDERAIRAATARATAHFS